MDEIQFHISLKADGHDWTMSSISAVIVCSYLAFKRESMMNLG